MKTKIIFLALLIAGINLMSCTSNASPEKNSSTDVKDVPIGLEEGLYAPNFTVKDVDNNHINLEDYKGKVVLIDFWATWCQPCLVSMPHLKDLYQKYGDRGFEIIGISADKSKSKLVDYVKEKELNWKQIYNGAGTDNAIYSNYRIKGIPHVFLIGKDGKILAEGHPMQLNLERLINKELSK